MMMMMCGSTKPKEAVVGGGGDSGTGPKCPRCGKTVYDAERAIGVNTVNVLFRFCPGVCLSIWRSVYLSSMRQDRLWCCASHRRQHSKCPILLPSISLSVCLFVSMRQDRPWCWAGYRRQHDICPISLLSICPSVCLGVYLCMATFLSLLVYNYLSVPDAARLSMMLNWPSASTRYNYMFFSSLKSEL